MKIVCTAIIDNPESRAKFFSQVDSLDANVYTVGSGVYAVYDGDDTEIRESLVSLFECEPRHTINIEKGGAK